MIALLAVYVLGGSITCYLMGRAMSEFDAAQALLFFVAWPILLPMALMTTGALSKRGRHER